jgi:SHS2 domain-containing protein
MAYHGYEEVEHTADIALRVWGEDFLALLEQAAVGMFDLIGVKPKPGSTLESRFEVQPGTHETVLVDFLTELLYLLEENHQALSDLSIEERDGGLWVSLSGYEIASQERLIKAVTYHNLSVKKTRFGWEATITFDV